MANKVLSLVSNPNIHVRTFKWTTLANGDIGVQDATPTYAAMGWYQDRCVQITGTFGSGGSISIEGSNDGGTTWAILTDPLGNVLTFTSAGMKQITELPALIRPHVTAGDGTTSLNCYIAARGANR